MEIFQVGGSIRDELLGIKPNDRDWVVVGSTPEEMEAKGFKAIGKDFPVFLHPKTKEEYALARTEKKSGVGYKGFTFYFDPSITLEEDLQRRDLTINAMAKDNKGKIIDPFNGKKDLEQEILKHTSPAFLEDPLRAIRLARFKTYGHLHNFKIAKETQNMLNKIASTDELSTLSAERIWMEVHKALNRENSDNFFKILVEFNLTDPWFTNLKKVSSDGSEPRYKWAEIQRVNNFKLAKNLPVPNEFKKTTEIIKKTLDLIAATSLQDKLGIIEALNIPQHSKQLEEILQLRIFRKDKDYLKSIIDTVQKIDFSGLINLQGSEISERKKLLYHKALKSRL